MATLDELAGDRHAEHDEQADGDERRDRRRRARSPAPPRAAPRRRARPWPPAAAPPSVGPGRSTSSRRPASPRPPARTPRRARRWRCGRPPDVSPWSRSTTRPSRAAKTSTPIAAPQATAADGEAVDHVVVVTGIVVEQGQALGADLARQPHGVLDRAVTPCALAGELGGRVLGVVDQQVDALAQCEHAVGDVRPAERLLVIADVGDARRTVRHAIAERLADMGHGAALDVEAADAELGGRFADVDPTGEGIDPDREHRRADRRGEDLGGRAAVVLRRGVDDELARLVQQRPEERQALDVVPVEVADEARCRGTVRRPGTSARSSAIRCRGRTAAGPHPARRSRRTTCCRRSDRCRRHGTESIP